MLKEQTAAAALADVLCHYDLGQYVEAYHMGTAALGPLEQWPGIPGRVLAGRLAYNLGGQRWGKLWHLRLCREYPDHGDLLFYQHLMTLSYEGPMEAWRQMVHVGLPESWDGNQRAELLSLRAQVLTSLRDFASAQRDIDTALAEVPDHLWVLVEQHSLLAAMDRREEALTATARAMELRPYYRPAVQLHAYELMQLNRDDEAEDLLRRAATHNQTGDLWGQLAALYSETRRFDQVAECLDRAESLYLLLERDKGLQRWLASRRSELAYRRGDYAQAIALAERIPSPYYRSIVQSLRDASERPAEETRDVLLDVRFVRQHHLTCAPATLSALATYWQHPVDHIDLAQSICYDGTPAHEERHWAEQQGFVTREFRVTWGNAQQLIDRGIPFTLTTVGPQMGHLQPVIGYDSRRGVLLVRDPGERHHIEYRGQELLEHFNATGPRGMAMVPADHAERLANLALDDSVQYDLSHRLHRALHDHQRQAAADCLQQMEALDPEHRLTLHARASLAFYDQDRVRQLRAVEALAERFPKDVNQQLVRLSLLRELGRRADYMQQLRKLCDDLEASPIFWRMLALELLEDQRALPEAGHWVQRVLREQQSAEDLRLASRYFWRQQQRVLAVQVMRLAALSDQRDESLAADYFGLARSNGETEAGLEFLRQRHETLGPQSTGPTYTYVWALETCDQYESADRALGESLTWRPQDSDSLLNAAQFYLGWGRAEEAQALLLAAEPIAHRTRWLNIAARYAMLFEDMATQETRYRQALELQPLNMSFVQALWEVLGDRQGSEAALGFLEDYLQRFPEHYELRQIWIGLLRRDDLTSRWVPELQRMLELHPEDPWALREMAAVLIELHRPQEALEFAEQALAIEPHVPASWTMRAMARLRLGQRDLALADFEQSLIQSIDWESGFQGWFDACESREERLRVLDVVQRELSSQVVTGDLLLTLIDHVQPTLDDAASLQLFRDMHAARPDLFQSWLALIEMLRRQDLLDEAAALMQQATARFSLLPRVWSDAAALAEQQEDRPRQIECLREALRINPRWPQVLYRLAMAQYDDGQHESAIDVLQQALLEAPRDTLLRCGLAELQWRDKQADVAIETMTDVVRQRPSFEYAWDLLQSWVQQVDKPDSVVLAARQLAQQRPREIQSWTLLYDVLPRELATREERHQVLQQALEINAQSIDALRRLAQWQAEQGDFEQAVSTCRRSIHGRPARTLQLCELDLLADYRSLQEAIQRLRAILQEDPDSASLWFRLADWAEKAGDWESYHQATAEMVRTAPGNAVSWGYHADSLSRREQTDEAIKHLWKAVQLDPTYDFASGLLSDLLLQQDKLAEVERLIERLRSRAAGGMVMALEMQLATRRRDLDRAAAVFARMLAADDLPEVYLQQGLRYLLEAEALPQAREQLTPHLSQGRRAVGRLWAVVAWKQGRAACVSALRELQRLPANEAWAAAAEFLLRNNDDHKNHAAGRRLLARRGPDLQADLSAWCAAGGYLVDVAEPSWRKVLGGLFPWGQRVQHRRCQAWLAGWEQRENLTNDHWFQLVRIAASLHDWPWALEMGALGQSDPSLSADGDAELIRLWCLVGLISTDQWDVAQEQVALLRDYELGAFYGALRQYLREALEVHTHATTSRAAGRESLERWLIRYHGGHNFRGLSQHDTFWRIHYDIEAGLRRTVDQPLPVWTRAYRRLRCLWLD